MSVLEVAIAFVVDGLPAPKGSPRVYVKDRRGQPLRAPRVRADSDATEAWAEMVAWAAKLEMRSGRHRPFSKSALRLDLVFYFNRPGKHLLVDGSVSDTAPSFPMTKPDGDKVQRTTQDAMQGIVFDEDSRIVDWHGYKRYTKKKPGAYVRVSNVIDIVDIPLGRF